LGALNLSFKVIADSAEDIRHPMSDVATDLVADMPFGGILTLITTPAHLGVLSDQWQSLEQNNATTPTIFQSFAWIKNWSDHYAQPNCQNEIHIVAGFLNNALVFALPLVKSCHMGVSTLNWVTDPLGQYGDVLCAKEQSLTKWMSASLRFINRLKGIDIIRLRHVRQNSIIENFASRYFVDAKLHEQAPYLDLTPFKSDADYDARYNSQQRKRRKKIRSKLEEIGSVEFKTLKPGSVNDHAISESIREKNEWLSERGRFNRVMGCPRHVQFLKSLSRSTTKDFEFVTTELSAGGKPVSWEIGFNYKGTHFAYITSHVNKLTDLSPGRLHMDLSQRLALSSGQERFDLMVPNDNHKESWCSGKVNTKDYFYATTWRGKLYGHFYLSVIRPAIRDTYYKLPQRILKLLQPLTRH
jgi:CelD/BcsL family acetyltransferase involved in cellulose biosynthesis